MQTRTTATTTTPEGTVALFTESIERGDLDAAMRLYEPNAAFKPSQGPTVTGVVAIRAALQGLVALKPTFHSSTKEVIRSGDIAMVMLDWSMTGTTPDGQEVSQSGISADVVRQQPDGEWRILLDVPQGTRPAGD